MEQHNLEYYKIGGLIRKYRKEKDLKLMELSELTGVKSAMLSKIENGRLIPTIPTLFTIINKLGVRADMFFGQLAQGDEFPGYIFIPKQNFTKYEKEEGAVGFHYQSILEFNYDGGAIQVSLLTLEPNSSRPQVATAAFEFIYILAGDIKYELEDKSFQMTAGDALFFDGNIPHLPQNNTNHAATLLVFYLFTSN
ncbi:XRE family transcriptional regulator [Chitinophaga skermanii]|uniref:XRE family transcriptional regulator n=2 Tax=Chitinophaga skermanii TaxID=331697 RepID=A0A327QX09_9BACT|nr:XRE family transcriptional regulator [Chitinophaga skermanii]